MENLVTDVCVVGGGSGGTGAALAAARAGADVVVVEALGKPGGTGTASLVCNWAAGPGNPLALEFYEDLVRTGSIGLAAKSQDTGDTGSQAPRRWLLQPQCNYVQSLQDAGVPVEDMRIVPFEPGQLANLIKQKLQETQKCRLLLNTTLISASSDGNNGVSSVNAKAADGTAYSITARTFIDCTGGVALCRMLNIPCALGKDDTPFPYENPSKCFGSGEPPGLELNSISLCYRVSQSAPGDIPQEAPGKWKKNAQVFEIPGGDFVINPLFMLPGAALIDKGYDKTMAIAKKRVKQHWSYMRSEYKDFFKNYKFLCHGELLGVRESFRVICEHMLTKTEVLAGLNITSNTVAAADHSLDLHLATTQKNPEGFKEQEDVYYPYGIPFECLIPKGWRNLLAACRGAGFTHEAASSCRLSRTMMSLGITAGTAAFLAKKQNIDARDVDRGDLINALRGPLIR
jgi:hypothetical protein